MTLRYTLDSPIDEPLPCFVATWCAAGATTSGAGITAGAARKLVAAACSPGDIPVAPGGAELCNIHISLSTMHAQARARARARPHACARAGRIVCRELVHEPAHTKHPRRPKNDQHGSEK